MERESFIFYRSFYESVKMLSNKDQLSIYNAIADYSLNGSCDNLSCVAQAIFILIKPQLDANNKRYENGTQAKKEQTRSKTQANVNVNDNENHNENENHNVNVNAHVPAETKNGEMRKRRLKRY